MILNAIKKGVSEERLARALNVNIASIRTKRNLLTGICPEAVRVAGKGGREVDHRLLVLGAVVGQTLHVAELLEGLSEAGDVAVAEDPPDPGDEAVPLAVALDLLPGEEPDDRLTNGQPDGVQWGSPALRDRSR